MDLPVNIDHLTLISAIQTDHLNIEMTAAVMAQVGPNGA